MLPGGSLSKANVVIDLRAADGHGRGRGRDPGVEVRRLGRDLDGPDVAGRRLVDDRRALEVDEAADRAHLELVQLEVDQRTGHERGRAGRELRAVDGALEAHAGLLGGERERGAHARARVGRTRVDHGAGLAQGDPRVRRRGRVDVVEAVDRAHGQRVLPGREAGQLVHGLAVGEGAAVERALEALDRFAGEEAEARLGPGLGARVQVDRGLRRRRVGGTDHEPLVEVGRRVGVAVGVDRAHLEHVRAAAQAGDRVRRGAGDEVTAVERALELVDRGAVLLLARERERGGGLRRLGVRARRRSTCPGALTSTTVQVRAAGVRSTLPVSSTARTRKVCSPGVSTSTCSGTEQPSNGPPSTEHSNSSSSSCVWSSAPVNSKLDTKLPVRAPGPLVIVVSGPVVSGPSTTSHS